jgi:U3 small nucleolar RNA-associated protein MPP10
MTSLIDILGSRPQDLLVPNDELKESSLKAVKDALDPIAGQYSIFDQVHVDGLDAEQVWTQVQMVVDGAIDKLLGEVIPKLGSKRIRSEVDSDEDVSENEEGEDNFSTLVQHGSDVEPDEELDEEMDGEMDEEMDYEEEENEEENEEEEEQSHDEQGLPQSELDSGLFRLADFQKQILDMEQDDDDDGNINYFADAAEQDTDSEGEDMRYDDFFATPKSIKSTVKNIRDQEEDDSEFEGLEMDDQIEQVMETTRKDLFADDDDDNDKEHKGMSRFEKQQMEIMKQIRQLEDENVAKKEWTVRGEVKARDRPLDSLVETDLDFERNVKPVPVITSEVTESLEDIIRRRIKTEKFDDIPRRIPDTLPEFKASKLVEVQETKSQKSLAELYEEDYVKNANPDTYQDAESEKVQAAHKEIVDLYGSLARKLDALSAWNYTPKAPKPAISIVSNAPAITMEDAQPIAMSTESMLAPQEVYRPGATDKREVVHSNGIPVAKAEMTREERKREKRRQKAKKAKMFKEKDEKQQARAQKEGSKANIIETLKKANVTVIGKKGEKRDVSGKLMKEKPKPAASNLKL